MFQGSILFKENFNFLLEDTLGCRVCKPPSPYSTGYGTSARQAKYLYTVAKALAQNIFLFYRFSKRKEKCTGPHDRVQETHYR